jgi:hypothetical protein
MTEMSRLCRRMIGDIAVPSLPPAPSDLIGTRVAMFCRFFGCTPDRRSLEDVRTFQVHLVAGGIS